MIEVRGLIPYVFCADAGAVADWCTTVFGWAERGRWSNDDGVVTNVELDPGGGGEVWLDGPVPDWEERTGGLGSWVGMVVDDVDAVHARLVDAGHEVPQPSIRPFGVRELSVTDPEGHRWGFIQRLASSPGGGP